MIGTLSLVCAGLVLFALPERLRTRDEVKAEAVEAAKHHRATLSESLDFLKN